MEFKLEHMHQTSGSHTHGNKHTYTNLAKTVAKPLSNWVNGFHSRGVLNGKDTQQEKTGRLLTRRKFTTKTW